MGDCRRIIRERFLYLESSPVYRRMLKDESEVDEVYLSFGRHDQESEDDLEEVTHSCRRGTYAEEPR